MWRVRIFLAHYFRGKNGGNRNARVPRIAVQTDVLRAGVGGGGGAGRGELSLHEPLCHTGDTTRQAQAVPTDKLDVRDVDGYLSLT